MKKFYLILSLLLANSISYSQQTTTGIIIDNTTRNIIPFATLELMGKGVGTVANDKGYFKWNIDDKYLNDTVTISALGYDKIYVVLKNIINQNKLEIKLKSRIFDLQAVVIKNTQPKIIKVGSRKKFMFFSGLYGSPGCFYAMYIKVDSNICGIIKTVGVYITKHGNSKGPLQIRLFHLDDDSLVPGEDIIKEPLLITGSDGGEWVDIDISKYHIPIPRKGFFIGVEWVKTSDEYFYKGGISGIEGYGPVLGHTSEFDKCITFFKYPGNVWYKVNAGGGEMYFNLMVRARLSTW